MAGISNRVIRPGYLTKLNYGSYIRQRELREPLAGQAPVFDELGYRVKIRVRGKIAGKNYLISDAAAGSSDESGVVSLKENVAR